MGGFDRIQRQRMTKRRGGALIEQDAHLRRAQTATSRVLEYRPYLLDGDAREPFDEFVGRGIVFQILEESSNGHARTAEHPGPAVQFRVSLDSVAGGPVTHA